MVTENTEGWQAGLSNPDGSIPSAEEVENITKALGWTIGWPEDPDVGVWVVNITPADVVTLMANGFIERKCPEGSAEIEVDLDQIGEA